MELVRTLAVLSGRGNTLTKSQLSGTGEHGVGLGKKEYLYDELGQGTVELMKTIKKTLDPLGIMNPGKVRPLQYHLHSSQKVHHCVPCSSIPMGRVLNKTITDSIGVAQDTHHGVMLEHELRPPYLRILVR